MKKIGLAVCYDSKNFGSQLQVLGTIKKIEELGYNTEIIRYKKKLTIQTILQTIPRFFNPYFLRGKFNRFKKNKMISKDNEIKNRIKKTNEKYVEFMKKNFLNMSEIYYGWNDLKKNANLNYDGFLVGSDQLWLPNNLGSHFYTLEFVDKKTKISYATSFGVSKIPWFQKKSTAKFLKKFTCLSSREKKGTEIIYNLTGINAKLVCDPTMLLTKQEWDKLIKKEDIIKEKYIFCYFLGTNIEHRKKAEELAKSKKLKIVTIPFLNNYVEYDKKFGDYQMLEINSFDFVNLIRNAEYVLTDSFHGTVFSIINHKKFITFNRFSDDSSDSRNSRIDSLCQILDMNNRRYSLKNFEKIDEEIDYEKIDNLLDNFRKDSIEYLSESLKKV